MELSPHSLTPYDAVAAFVVWLGSLSSRPLAHPVPYLRNPHIRAAPKCISGRTSYLRVRLAFHPYPQLIQSFCNTRRFGPPRGFTRASPWPWVAHPVSGLIPATAPCSDSLSLRLRGSCRLTPRRRLTRRLILQ